MRLRWRVCLLTAVVTMSSLAVASPALALPYDGTNPGATPCGDGSHPVTILDSEQIISDGNAIGRVELRQSAYCATVWSRVYNGTTSTLNLRETIIVYSSPNVTGPTAYPITDNSIPPGGSAWSKQYRDRPAFRAKGEIYYSGAWRSAQTSPSIMWSQREGNYADPPSPTQPYTCGDAANPCVRWPTINGSPITLYYQNSSSLDQLSGDPYGDINFILNKYTALTGPAPDLAQTTGAYQILNFAFTDSNHLIYALSISTAGSDHYLYTGYTKFNTSATFTAGYRAVECHEFLHLLGFNHITVTGFTGSQATCMGYPNANGPSIDDQYLLDQTYSAPVGP